MFRHSAPLNSSGVYSEHSSTKKFKKSKSCFASVSEYCRSKLATSRAACRSLGQGPKFIHKFLATHMPVTANFWRKILISTSNFCRKIKSAQLFYSFKTARATLLFMRRCCLFSSVLLAAIFLSLWRVCWLWDAVTWSASQILVQHNKHTDRQNRIISYRIVAIFFMRYCSLMMC